MAIYNRMMGKLLGGIGVEAVIWGKIQKQEIDGFTDALGAPIGDPITGASLEKRLEGESE